MGATQSDTKNHEIITTANIRINYPLYKTEYSTPGLDYKMLKSQCWYLADPDIEKYRYVMDSEIMDKYKKRK